MRISTLAFAAASALTASFGMAHAADQDFKLVNRTGYQIDEVYVSPHSASKWGSDIMGQDSLGDGETVNITFPHGTDACHYDLKVKYHDDDTAEWGNLDLCSDSKITLHWDGKNTRATEE